MNLPSILLKLFLLVLIQILFYYSRNYFVNNQDTNETLKRIPYLLNLLNSIFSFLIILSIFNVDLNKFYLFLGTSGAIILFSVQQIFRDFISGIIILLSTKTYDLGDLIEIKEKNLLGIVKEINFFTTTIQNRENVLVYIPNTQMYDNMIYNYSKNGILSQFYTFGINFDSNFVRVKEIIKQSMKQISIIIPDLTFDSIIPCVTVKKFEDSKAIVEIRIVVKFEDRFKSKQLVYEAINFLISENLIQIPYPKLDLKLSQSS